METKMKKLVIMFPGVGYTMDCPLLYYASFLFEAKGYEQIHMKYNHILFEEDLTKEEKTLKASVDIEDLSPLAELLRDE